MASTIYVNGFTILPTIFADNNRGFYYINGLDNYDRMLLGIYKIMVIFIEQLIFVAGYCYYHLYITII
jgi:hypothetical protein